MEGPRRLRCGRGLFAQAGQRLLADPIIFSGFALYGPLQRQTSPQDYNQEGDREHALSGDGKQSHVLKESTLAAKAKVMQNKHLSAGQTNPSGTSVLLRHTGVDPSTTNIEQR